MKKSDLIRIIREELRTVLHEQVGYGAKNTAQGRKNLQKIMRSSGSPLANIPDWSPEAARRNKRTSARQSRIIAKNKKDNQDIIQQIYSQAGRSGALNRELSVKSDGNDYDFKIFNHEGDAAVSVSGNSFKVSEASSGRSPEIDLIETDGNTIKITGSWGPFNDSVFVTDSMMKDFLKAIAKLQPSQESLIDFAGLRVKLDPIS